jgi:hypothetical protein
MKKIKNFVMAVIVAAFLFIVVGAFLAIISIALKKDNNTLLYVSIGLMAFGALIYIIIFVGLAIRYKKKG